MTRDSIVILVLSFLFLISSVTATMLTVNNVEPSLDAVSLTDTTGTIVTTVHPGETNFVNFTARDNNCLSDLNSITVKVYYDDYMVPSKSTHYNFTWTQATNSWTSNLSGYVVSSVKPPDFSVASFDFSLGFKLDESAMLNATTIWHVNVTAADSADNLAINDTITFTGGKFTIPLYEDWNLVSTPLELHDTSPVSVFSAIAENCSIVWVYDASESNPWKKWKKYIPDAPPFASTLTEVNHKMGIWIKMEEDDALIVTGSVPVATSINLKVGWNMIGYPNTTKPVGDALNASIDGNYSGVYAYNATDTEYHWKFYNPELPVESDLQDMVPGSGYWIYMTSECTLEI